MKKDLKSIRLALLFSAGVGLDTWASNGSLHREAALYKLLSGYLNEVDFITYGGTKDYRYKEEIGRIGLYPTMWLRRPHRLANYLLPINSAITSIRHRKVFTGVDILKTNQISGSQIAVAVKKKFNKKLIVRCGYVPSRLAGLAKKYAISTDNLGSSGYIAKTERCAFQNADIITVPTENDRGWIMSTYNIAGDKIRVVPNYVETDRFRPMPEAKKRYDLIVVARNSPEKNIKNIIGALYRLQEQGLNLSTMLVGSCGKSDIAEKEKAAGRLSIATSGNVDNRQLPEMLSSAKIFLIASFYEGNPKALLEAMSCGMPCIGTDVDSINKVISHLRTGYLCGIDEISIAKAVKEVIGDGLLQKRIGENARSFVSDNFSIGRILDMELNIIKELA